MTKHQTKNEAEESNRMWASASFVGVLIIVGLPLWWKTTEVYRVALPYEKISSFKDLRHVITSEVVVLANDEPTASEIAGLIEKDFDDIDILNLKITKSILSDDLHHSLNTVADEAEAVEALASVQDLTARNKIFVVQRTPLFEEVWMAEERVVFFREAKAAPILVEVLKQWVYQVSVLEGARSEVADQARRTRFPPGDGYHIVLSVVQPRPDAMKLNFDAEQALEDYIGSYVDELSELHNFTLKSQWLYLVDFDFQATEVKDTSDWTRHFAVQQDRLPLLLTRIEERAATLVSELTTINLVLYAVPCAQAPLAIYQQDRKIPVSIQAFMSPRWGGVVLYNPPHAACAAPAPAPAPAARAVMGAFLAQLGALLGTPPVGLIPGAHLEPPRAAPPRRWEADTVLRVRALEHLASAQTTLTSLAQLLGEISNIVINDEVGASINLAVDSIHLASQQMAAGKLLEAYRSSQTAYRAAETAFMEPSLLALLYFPDDQKYAIYIPLFLPIMFPVILSLKNLLLWFRGKPIHKEDKEKTE